jgi:hypothetical protein
VCPLISLDLGASRQGQRRKKVRQRCIKRGAHDLGGIERISLADGGQQGSQFPQLQGMNAVAVERLGWRWA